MRSEPFVRGSLQALKPSCVLLHDGHIEKTRLSVRVRSFCRTRAVRVYERVSALIYETVRALRALCHLRAGDELATCWLRHCCLCCLHCALFAHLAMACVSVHLLLHPTVGGRHRMGCAACCAHLRHHCHRDPLPGLCLDLDYARAADDLASAIGLAPVLRLDQVRNRGSQHSQRRV